MSVKDKLAKLSSIFHTQSLHRSTSRSHSAFTIVEMVVVIAIIGILATVTIVSYKGVTGHAREVALQTDLSHNADAVDIYQSYEHSYPSGTGNDLNGGQGLKVSNGNKLTYYTNDPTNDAYCIQAVYPATNPTIAFFVTDTKHAPQKGVCSGVTGVLDGAPDSGGDGGGGGSGPPSGFDHSTLATYCSPSYTYNAEPITKITFAGISNSSSVPTSSPTYEDFTTIYATVNVGSTYTINAEGNSDGSYTNYFTVYIDWDHDGTFSETSERYNIGTIDSSTGLDGKQATASILIPTNAVTGSTTMRVRKNYATYIGDACSVGSYGQTEDYGVLISP
ncbi:MAG: GEVED domain-containing protein [Candidatus Saccharimonas sp.]